MTLRRLFVVGAVIVGAVYAVFREPLEGLLAPPCTETLALDPDTPADVAARLSDLQDRQLLYCPEIPRGVQGVGEHLYWGADGVDAVLYFDYAPEHPVRVDLHYDDSFVHPRGGWPLPGLDTRLRPAYRSAAPEGASFFYLATGAPRPTNSSVIVEITGEGTEQGTQHRDFFKDLEGLWSRVRGQAPASERARVETRFAIVPERAAAVTGIWMAPAYQPPEGFSALQALRADPPAEPVVYRVAAGPLGTGVWVTGIVTGARPSLVLRPAEAPPNGDPVAPAGDNAAATGGTDTGAAATAAGQSADLEPVAFSLWRDVRSNAVHVLAAFPPLPVGSAWRPVYRDAAADRASALDTLIIPGPDEIVE